MILKITNSKDKSPIIKINNELIEYKRNKYNTIEIDYKSNDEFIDLEVYELSELNTKFYYFWLIIYGIISFFGLFDLKNYYKKYTYHYKGKIKVLDEVIISFAYRRENGTLFDSNPFVELNESNKYIMDKTLKRRILIKNLINLGLFIITIIILIIYLEG